MPPSFVGAEELHAALSMTAAVDALEHAFGLPLPHAPDRSHLDTGSGDLLIMPAWGELGAGVKLVTVAPDNPEQGLPLIQGVYVLFEQPSLTPVALFDAAALTALRTAAVSGVATRYLARQGAASLVIFGAGAQAEAHLAAMATVRPLERVRVVSRTQERARKLVERARSLGLRAEVAEPEAVRESDLVCTCTTSPEPVFPGGILAEGTHVNAVGSYKPFARELDDAALARARVVVDTRTALVESGDLIAPLENGTIHAEAVVDLATLVSEQLGRTSDAEITVFKSVGAAFEDLVIARAASQRL